MNYGSRYFRGYTPYGTKDLSSLEMLAANLEQLVGGELRGKEAEIQLGQERAEEEAIRRILGGLGEKPTGTDFDRASLALLAHGGKRVADVAGIVSKMRRPEDQSLTPFEAWYRGDPAMQAKVKAFEEMKAGFQPWTGDRYEYRPRLDDKGQPVRLTIGDNIQGIMDEYDRRTGLKTENFKYQLLGQVPKPEDVVGKELKGLQLEKARREATQGEQKTVNLSLFNPTTGRITIKTKTGTKKQLVDVIKSEISAIERVVPYRKGAAGGGGFLGIGASTSWENFLNNPSEKAIEDLDESLQGYAASYLDLTDKLESLEGEFQLEDEVQLEDEGGALVGGGEYTLQPSQPALDYLNQHRNDPEVVRQFKEKYGALPPKY